MTTCWLNWLCLSACFLGLHYQLIISCLFFLARHFLRFVFLWFRDNNKCPSVALMFQIGRDATYHSVSYSTGLLNQQWNMDILLFFYQLIQYWPSLSTRSGIQAKWIFVLLDGWLQGRSWLLHKQDLQRSWSWHYALLNWKCYSWTALWWKPYRQQQWKWRWQVRSSTTHSLEFIAMIHLFGKMDSVLSFLNSILLYFYLSLFQQVWSFGWSLCMESAL